MIELVIGAVVAVCVLAAVFIYLRRRTPTKNSSEETVEQDAECSEPESEKDGSAEEKAAEPESVAESTAEDRTEPVSEDPKACIALCASAGTAANGAEEASEIDTGFMSKLVASKDASDRAAEIPLTRKREDPMPAADDVPEPKEAPVADMAAEPEPKPVAEPSAESESEPVAEAATKPEPVPSESPAVGDSAVSEPVVETGDSAVDSEPNDEDTYTDYSPEALVRRAAWNKGLRCRRQYGDHAIQVAFVKPKVAVYVLDPSEAIPDVDKVAEEGWTILRFDMNSVTDGMSEGDAIADAVKASLRAQKASKKKSGKK